MTSQTIPGIFRDGKVELESVPAGLADGTPVKVEVLAVDRDALDEEREASRKRAVARMEEGFHLGGAPYPSRDELYDRHGR